MLTLMGEVRRVLFVCTHNSARSQMAEGLLRHLHGSRYEAYSAGLKPSTVNPYAVKVMAEMGVDISAQRSKSIDEFKGKPFDYVVTVCSRAEQACPTFPGAGKLIHTSFKDPSEITGTEEEILIGFRQTRDEIKHWIQNTLPLKRVF